MHLEIFSLWTNFYFKNVIMFFRTLFASILAWRLYFFHIYRFCKAHNFSCINYNRSVFADQLLNLELFSEKQIPLIKLHSRCSPKLSGFTQNFTSTAHLCEFPAFIALPGFNSDGLILSLILCIELAVLLLFFILQARTYW